MMRVIKLALLTMI